VSNGSSGSGGLRIGTGRYVMNAGADRAGTVATPDTAGHTWRLTFDTANTLSRFWVDGVSDVAAGTSGTNAYTRIKIGCGGSGGTNGNFAHCQIGFVGYYAGSTSDTDLATLATDLETYYAI
jgi:hypothetical protein